MDLQNEIADRASIDPPIEQRIRDLAIESDSGVDTVKAFLLKVSAEIGVALPVGAVISIVVYVAISVALYDPGPLQEVIVGGSFAFAMRSWCMLGPLSEA